VNLTEPELQAIYGEPDSAVSPTSALGTYKQSATTTTVGDIQISGSGATQVEKYVTVVSPLTTVTIVPSLPQSSSGTRQTFLTAIGAPNNTTFGLWVDASESREENNAAALTAAGQIEPFSGASLIAQQYGLVANSGVNVAGISFPSIKVGSVNQTLDNGLTGSAAALNGTAANRLQGSATVKPTGLAGDFTRDVFDVVPSANLGVTVPGTSPAKTYTVFLDSTLPSSADSLSNPVVADYGFEPLGSSYLTNHTNWFFSNWEH